MEKFREMVKGWLGYTLLGLLIVLFAVTGIESYFTGGPGKQVVATVNDEELTQPQVDKAVEEQKRQILEQMGPAADPAQIDMARLKKDVLDGLIQRTLLSQQAANLKVDVSDAVLGKMLAEAPVFQEDGKFSQQRFEQFLGQMGETQDQFLSKVREGIRIQQLQVGLAATGFVTNKDAQRLFALDAQKRDISYAAVPALRFLPSVTVQDAEIKAFYDKNHAKFTTDELVSLEYIELKQGDFASQVAVTAEDLKARYEERKAKLSGDEQRQASHILISVDAKTPANQALVKIRDIEKRVRAGEDFAKLAKEFSQDPGSVANGGDLGLAGKGMFVPEFEKALFALKEGDVSAPVKTQFGYHLIKLTKIKAASLPSMEELRPQLEAEVRASKEDDLFQQRLAELNDATYEASDLKDPAEKFKLAIVKTELFSRKGGTGLAADKKVVDAAFSDDVLKEGKNSVALEVGKGQAVWVRVAEHKPSALRPLAEVSPLIRQQLQLEAARKKAGELAESVAKAISAGETHLAAGTRNALQWQEKPGLDRRTALPSQDMMRAAFRLKRPAAGKQTAEAVRVGNDYAVVVLSGVTEGAGQPAQAESKQMQMMISQSQGQQELLDYVAWLKASAKIERRADKPADKVEE